MCRTKNLQVENYGQTYSFDVLKGRGNYRCVHPDGKDRMASECLFIENMRKCDSAWDCPYLIQKSICQGSNK